MRYRINAVQAYWLAKVAGVSLATARKQTICLADGAKMFYHNKHWMIYTYGGCWGTAGMVAGAGVGPSVAALGSVVSS